MSTSLQHILDSFDLLPEPEKRRLAAEIIRRTVKLDSSSLTDEELVLSAEGLFLELDRRESMDE